MTSTEAECAALRGDKWMPTLQFILLVICITCTTCRFVDQRTARTGQQRLNSSPSRARLLRRILLARSKRRALHHSLSASTAKFNRDVAGRPDIALRTSADQLCYTSCPADVGVGTTQYVNGPLIFDVMVNELASLILETAKPIYNLCESSHYENRSLDT